jgi:uncharacterized surface protein with fasciclin (FAS1) repeats
MRNYLKIAILLSIVMFSFVRCSNEKDTYFDRPGWLEPPIYQVLEKQGKFTNYLKCVDKTLYAGTLKASGLYTVFAPNDEAFKKYLSAKGFASVADIPDSLANQIVSYSIVYNKYSFDRLSDVLSGGWDTLTSIKKKTTYYEMVHQENFQNKNIWVWDAPTSGLNYVGDQNYKYIPLYLTRSFGQSRTTAQAADDYSIFYSTPYTGNNVQSASVVTKDMAAENGVVHEIDQVLEPLPNIEKLLNDPNYSSFKTMLNKQGSTGVPYFISYIYSKPLSDLISKAAPTKNITDVYMKYYTGLAVNLNSERYGASTKEAEQGGITIFAPSNAAVDKFYEEKLKTYYPAGLPTVSKDILTYFINAQVSNELVWPNDYKGSLNALGDFFNGLGSKGAEFSKTNYIKTVPASNGLFYGSDNYIKSRYFETVFTEILLNPNYSLLNNAFIAFFNASLKEELLKCELNGYTQENYTVLLPSNAQLIADGFSWVWGSNSYVFANSNSGSTLGNFDVNLRMQRLVKSHIFKRIKNNEINCALTNFNTDPSFASAYGGYSYAVNDFGDMIRYKNGKLQMVGNADENQEVTATLVKTFTNGQVFTVDKLLQYSRRTTLPTVADGYKTQDLLVYINTMATANPNVSKFRDYLKAVLNTSGNDLLGLSNDMGLTMFMPNNTAIAKAITDGVLPATTATIATVPADRTKTLKFIYYHIVKGKNYVDDGLPYIMPNSGKVTEETASTVLKDVVDETYLAIRKDASGNLVVSTTVLGTGKSLTASTKGSQSLTVTRGLTRSNFFGGRAVLHEINGYFDYVKVP